MDGDAVASGVHDRQPIVARVQNPANVRAGDQEACLRRLGWRHMRAANRVSVTLERQF